MKKEQEKLLSPPTNVDPSITKWLLVANAKTRNTITFAIRKTILELLATQMQLRIESEDYELWMIALLSLFGLCLIPQSLLFFLGNSIPNEERRDIQSSLRQLENKEKETISSQMKQDPNTNSNQRWINQAKKTFIFLLGNEQQKQYNQNK